MQMDDASVATAYVALGSNLGERLSHLRTATARFEAHAQIRVRRCSPVYASEALTARGAPPQPDYLNAVLHLGTTLSPEALLAYGLSLEDRAGRRRTPGRRWEPRPLDADVLLFDDRILQAPWLVLPHPRLGERRFVLRPLADLAPDLYVPEPFGRRVAELLASCPDRAEPTRTRHRLCPPEERP